MKPPFSPLPALCALLFLGSPGCSKGPFPGSNVVLVVVDTLRADHCSPYGYSPGVTPALRRFAEEGVLFETAVPQASFTMASMGTLFTSTYPHHHGASRHPSLLGLENATLAERFLSKGYATAAFVCNPLLEDGSGFEQGFEEYVYLEEKDTGGADGLIRQGIQWLERDRDRPFFLWLHLLDPHFPYVPRPGFIRVQDVERKAHQEYLALLKERNKGRITTGEIFFECSLSPEAVRQAVKAYDSEVAYADHHFGLLLEALKRLGLEEDTVVVFTSDHGESLGEHGVHFSHGFSVYDPALKVPLVIRLPGRASRGRRVKETVRLLDLMPTLLSLTGIDPPDAMMGRDLSPLMLDLEEGPGEPPPPAFAESEPMYLDGGKRRYPQRKRIYLEGDPGKWRTVLNERYKLILIPRAEEPELELYDLAADPGEERNIAAEQPGVVEQLRTLLEEWIEDPARRDPVSTPELDEEWARRLQDIGYIR